MAHVCEILTGGYLIDYVVDLGMQRGLAARDGDDRGARLFYRSDRLIDGVLLFYDELLLSDSAATLAGKVARPKGL